jgi:hypothetical protein
VSSFVCTKGADVMLPGCAEENLGDFESGDHRMLLVHHAYVGDKGETITHPGKVNAMPIGESSSLEEITLQYHTAAAAASLGEGHYSGHVAM